MNHGRPEGGWAIGPVLAPVRSHVRQTSIVRASTGQQRGQAELRLARLPMPVRHSWPLAHCHHTTLCDFGVTWLAVRVPFLFGCHWAANEGDWFARLFWGVG